MNGSLGKLIVSRGVVQPTFAGMDRIGQLAIVGKLTAGSWLKGAMISSVM